MTWSHTLSLGEVPRDGVTLALSPTEAERKALARDLDLLALDRLDARVRIIPWLDGVQIDGQWSADVAQACGVTLDRLDSALAGDFMVRAVPAGSPHAPSEEEVEISLDADDPPDVLERDEVDLAAYVVEHLALEIDPFPRKPGVEFVQPTETVDLSPFAVLKKLRPESE
jgi:uncharacterized metal-binding protein YceD (DUF177 family)